MPVPELSYNVHWIETSVLRKCIWYNLKGLGESTDTVGLLTVKGLRVFTKLDGELNLRGTTATDKELLLNKAAGSAEGIVEGALSLIEEHLVGCAEEDGGNTAHVLDASDLDDLADSNEGLGTEGRLTELLGGEGADVGDWLTVEGLADELDVIALNVTDDHDFHLGEEVKCEIVECVAEDGLLDEEHVTASLLNSLANLENVLLLLTKDAVHGGVIGDDHVRLHVGLQEKVV